LGKKIYTLGRNEIIRGYRSFENILKNSRRLETRYLTGFVKLYGDDEVKYGFSQGDVSVKVKVGFLLAKKKLKNHTNATG
jgi:hypothetical protein